MFISPEWERAEAGTPFSLTAGRSWAASGKQFATNSGSRQRLLGRGPQAPRKAVFTGKGVWTSACEARAQATVLPVYDCRTTNGHRGDSCPRIARSVSPPCFYCLGSRVSTSPFQSRRRTGSAAPAHSAAGLAPTGQPDRARRQDSTGEGPHPPGSSRRRTGSVRRADHGAPPLRPACLQLGPDRHQPRQEAVRGTVPAASLSPLTRPPSPAVRRRPAQPASVRRPCVPLPATPHDSPFRLRGTGPGCTGVPADHLAEVTERLSLIIPMVFFDVRGPWTWTGRSRR